MSWWIIHFGMFLSVVRPLCPLANPLLWCFCLGSCPFCVSGLLFFFDETQIWLGICGSSGWFVWFLVCCDLPAFPDLLGLCTNDVFTAYAHVRTEPQCDIGHTREKKIMCSRWELGSFASGGITSKPPGYQFILWDTNAKINGLVAADLETLVSHSCAPLPPAPPGEVPGTMTTTTFLLTEK